MDQFTYYELEEQDRIVRKMIRAGQSRNLGMSVTSPPVEVHRVGGSIYIENITLMDIKDSIPFDLSREMENMIHFHSMINSVRFLFVKLFKWSYKFPRELQTSAILSRYGRKSLLEEFASFLKTKDWVASGRYHIP